MLGISGTELVIILFFGFLVFGPEKLPQMGRTIGRAIRQFRNASDAMNQKFKEEVADPFQEAVAPYAEEIDKVSGPMREDIAAINKTFQDVQSTLTNPLKTAMNSVEPPALTRERIAQKAAEMDAADAAAAADPFADAFGETQQEEAPAKSMAAELYGLDDDATAPQEADAADNAASAEAQAAEPSTADGEDE